MNIHVMSDSDKGCCDDHDVEIETDDFVWDDALEEIIFMAKRLLDKVSIEKNPESKADDPDCVKNWIWMQSKVQMFT